VNIGLFIVLFCTSIAVGDPVGSVVRGAACVGVVALNILIAIPRFHDLGKPSSNVLLFLIPFYNAIVFARLFLRDSQLGPNEYGNQPVKRILRVALQK